MAPSNTVLLLDSGSSSFTYGPGWLQQAPDLHFFGGSTSYAQDIDKASVSCSFNGEHQRPPNPPFFSDWVQRILLRYIHHFQWGDTVQERFIFFHFHRLLNASACHTR